MFTHVHLVSYGRRAVTGLASRSMRPGIFGQRVGNAAVIKHAATESSRNSKAQCPRIELSDDRPLFASKAVNGDVVP
jgi:hypothetical protein